MKELILLLIRKRRAGKYKEVDYNKKGRDFKEIFKKYFSYTKSYELRLFLGLPFIISLSVFVLFAFFEQSNTKILEYIMEINNISLNVVAILAGFNTTSLSIIAAGNNKVFKEYRISNEVGGVVEQLIVFFSFSILLQLVTLVTGIFLSISLNIVTEVFSRISFFTGFYARLPLVSFGVFWLTVILFSIAITIRNATLTYRYVLIVSKPEKNNSDS